MRSKILLVALVSSLFIAVPGVFGEEVQLGSTDLQPAVRRIPAGHDGTATAHPQHLPEPTSGGDVGPGSHLLITMASEPGLLFSCTANFVWASGATRYLGAAGHCFLPADKTATAGPGADYNPAGTQVRVCVEGCDFGGESGFILTGTTAQLGSVAYARQTQGGQDVGNDFGIVEIPSSLAGRIRPSMPVWGGPTQTENVTLGSVVCHYGNGVGVGEVWPTKGRAGVGVGVNSGGYWLANLAAAPGDSGSAVEVCVPDGGGVHGRGAAGVLTHLVLGAAGTTVGTTTSKAISMATQAGLNISVVLGQ